MSKTAQVLHDQPVLHRQLDRWVAEGLLDQNQATRIESVEAAREGQPTRRSALAIEALGYLGGLLAAIAGVITEGMLWPDISTGAELAFAATGAALLVVVGAVVTPRELALARLRSVLKPRVRRGRLLVGRHGKHVEVNGGRSRPRLAAEHDADANHTELGEVDPEEERVLVVVGMQRKTLGLARVPASGREARAGHRGRRPRLRRPACPAHAHR